MMKIFTFLLLIFSLNALNAQCDPEIMASSTLLCPNEVLILTTTDTFDTYQWFREGEPIAGATEAEVEISFYEAAAATFHLEVTIDTCRGVSESVFIDGYAFLPIFLIVSGRYGFDPEEEAFVLCDSTQYGGPDTLILEIGLPYDTLITWYKDGIQLAHNENILVVTEPGIYTASAAPTICPGFFMETLPTVVREGTPAVIHIVEQDRILMVESDQMLFYYQWFLNGEPIDGANASTHEPEQEGIYNVYAETRFCGSWSPNYTYLVGSVKWSSTSLIDIYPNPFAEMIAITRPTVFGEATISLLDLNGKICFKQEIRMQESTSLNIQNIPSGPYILLYTSEKENYRRLVVKE
jgi:hypothetical protein